MGWCGYKLGKCSVPAVLPTRHSQYHPVVTKINLPFFAVVTFSAINCGIKGDPVPNCKTGNAGPAGLNYSGCFVPHNERGNTPTTASVKAMHIASTNPACLHPDQHLILAMLRYRAVLNFKPLGCGEHHGFHKLLCRLEMLESGPLSRCLNSHQVHICGHVKGGTIISKCTIGGALASKNSTQMFALGGKY